LKLIHISDAHWHSDNKNNSRQIELVHALEPYLETHYILNSGDVTDDGAEAQYLRAAKWMGPWKQKSHWVFIPGNHSYGYKGNWYSNECARRFDEMLSVPFNNGYFFDKTPMLTPIYEGNNCHLIIALNSNLKTDTPFDFACGEIGQKQLDQLSDILWERGEYTTITLMLHHHPWLHWDPFMRLKDANKLLNRIKGKIDILLFGHRHVAGEWYGRWNIPLTLAAPSTPAAGWFNEITIQGKAISVRKIHWRI